MAQNTEREYRIPRSLSWDDSMIAGMRTDKAHSTMGRSPSLPRSISTVSTAPGFCPTCFRLLTDIKWQTERRSGTPETVFTRMGRVLHQPSFVSLFYSAEYHRCSICSVILRKLWGSQSLTEAAQLYNVPGFETLWEFLGGDGESLQVFRAKQPTVFDLGGFRPLARFTRISRPGKSAST